ncbi:hypothetical protein AAG906_013293 [Vitis piasezkii]
MSNIGYPFWGGSRPTYCGHPGLDLNCDGYTQEFRMMSVSYRVLDINNSSDTLTVARYLNTTLNRTLFSYNTTYPNLCTVVALQAIFPLLASLFVVAQVVVGSLITM